MSLKYEPASEQEVIRERDLLYMVFEFLDLNLYEVSKNRSKPFSEVSSFEMCSGSEAGSCLRLIDLDHSTLGLRVIKKKKKKSLPLQEY